MNIYTIWKQYPQSYPGELMPNIYEAADQYLNDDNPDYFYEAEERAKKEVADGTITAYRIIVLELDEDVVTDAFANVRTLVTTKP